MKRPALLCAALMIAMLGIANNAAADCLRVPTHDPRLKIDPVAMAALSQAKLDKSDLYKVMKVVATYETAGCWAGATGNFDNQWLSAGVMQWNFGTGSLQLLLKEFREKFSDRPLFDKKLAELMPHYGRKLFDTSCRTIPIGQRCIDFLRSQYIGDADHLSADFELEVNELFESEAMRQIQVDYFVRNLTRVLDDLNRVFQQREPRAWQIAWAMDLKTQQGKFPSDSSIKRIRKSLVHATLQERQGMLLGIVEWYEGLCRSGDVGGVRFDYSYNVDTWTHAIKGDTLVRDREEAVHFTYLVSRTARNEDGLYQADAFQRRATIAFGRGQVHRSVIEIPE